MIPVVNQSVFISGCCLRDARFIAALLCQHGPGDACQLVSKGRGQNVRMQALSISKIILVPLPKRLRIRRRNLLHIVAKRGKLASNIVCRHSCFDTNEAGLQVCKPRCNAPAQDLFSQHKRPVVLERREVTNIR